MSTKKFAVIGDPVSHSLSPLMHTGWFADHGIDATYEALTLRSDDPVAAIRALKGFAGVNVTIPHKEAAAAAAHEPDFVVQMLKAANTLTWRDDRIAAANTDYGGFGRALDEVEPKWRNLENALVVGAGGAGRSIAFSLSGQDGPHITIINRSVERAELVARLVHPYCGQGAEARPWEDIEDCIAQSDVIVNATSLGLVGGERFDWPLYAARQSAVVADIVYRPLETDLLRAARARGLRTVDGLGMLIHQGALAFHLWFGVMPDTAKARERLMAALA